MKKFTLKLGKDVILRCSAFTMEDAIDYFSIIKNLDPSDILKIYEIEGLDDKSNIYNYENRKDI